MKTEDITDYPELKMENFHDVTSTKAKHIMKEYLKDTKDKNTADAGVEKFNNWMISRAKKNKQVSSNISYVCSQFAILEASENIFVSGIGLKKLDLNGFNLKMILEILRKIGDNVEVILNAPQKEAVLHFQTFVRFRVAMNKSNYTVFE